MADRGPPFAALRALEAACRLKSYSLAGDELGVTHSAVSQSVRRLEQTYGQRAVPPPRDWDVAEPRGAVALAQAYREAERVLVRAAEDAEDARTAKASLVLSTLPSIAKLWLGPKLEPPARRAAGHHGRGAHQPRARQPAHRRRRRGPARRPRPLARPARRAAVRRVRLPGLQPGVPGAASRPQLRRTRASPLGPLILEDVDLWPAWFETAGVAPPTPLRGPVFDDSALVRRGRLGRARRRAGAPAARAGGAGRRPPGAHLATIRVKDPYSCYLVWRDDSPRDRRHPPLRRLGAGRMRPRRAAEGRVRPLRLAPAFFSLPALPQSPR